MASAEKTSLVIDEDSVKDIHVSELEEGSDPADNDAGDDSVEPQVKSTMDKPDPV
jgi:hypothetical protein